MTKQAASRSDTTHFSEYVPCIVIFGIPRVPTTALLFSEKSMSRLVSTSSRWWVREMTKPVNSNLGWENSFPVCVLLLPWLSALRAAWLVWTQQKQEIISLNLNMNWQAWRWRRTERGGQKQRFPAAAQKNGNQLCSHKSFTMRRQLETGKRDLLSTETPAKHLIHL